MKQVGEDRDSTFVETMMTMMTMMTVVPATSCEWFLCQVTATEGKATLFLRE